MSLPVNQKMPNVLLERKELNNRYIVIRHGHAYSNQRDTLVSSDLTDGPQYGLTETGQEQIRESLRAWFSFKDFSDLLTSEQVIIICSPRVRAQQTAAIIQNGLKQQFSSPPSIETREELNERNFGNFDGKSVSNWNVVAKADSKDPFVSFENAESVHSMYIRINNLLEDLEKNKTGKTLILVSHCDPIQILIAVFNNLSPQHYSDVGFIENGESRILTLI